MPYAYAVSLSEGAASKESDVRPSDHMTWSFYGGTLDPTKQSFENIVFFFVIDPYKLKTMMDDLENVKDEYIEKLKQTKNGALIGLDRLKTLNKHIGERFTVTGLNYKGIDLEFEIVGTFPNGTYNNMGIMNTEYLLDALDAYARNNKGKKHPLADKSLNLVWLKVPDTDVYRKLAEQVTASGMYRRPGGQSGDGVLRDR